jgi:hypothetical protein
MKLGMSTILLETMAPLEFLTLYHNNANMAAARTCEMEATLLDTTGIYMVKICH